MGPPLRAVHIYFTTFSSPDNSLAANYARRARIYTYLVFNISLMEELLGLARL